MSHSHTLELPALDGRDPLGFLASLGLLRVLSHHQPTRLSFAPDTHRALLTSPHATVDAVVTTLTDIVHQTSDDHAIPDIDPQLPFKAGTGRDPMRPDRADFPTFVQQIESIDRSFAQQWLPHLLTDLATDHSGRAALTPFMAPRGKQNMRTFFNKALTAIKKNPEHLSEALSGWRRVTPFTGEYFDHRVIRSAADDVHGQTSQEAGVPGATWLATMALPTFRLTSNGTHTTATLWHTINGSTYMIWPVWHPPLDPHAVQCLLEHPTLRPIDDRPTVSDHAWHPLGILTVAAANRHHIPGANFDGVLAPVPVHVA